MDFTSIICASVSPVTIALAVGAAVILIFVVVPSSFLKYISSPGPWGIPVLGYYPFLPNVKQYIPLAKLAEKHGDAYLLNLCGKVYLHIGSYKAAKEAFVTKSDCFSERTQDHSLFIDVFKNGIIAINGEAWRMWRKFIVQSMREIGLGSKEQLRNPIQEAVQETIMQMEINSDQVINITTLLLKQCTEVIRRLMIGDNISEETIYKINDTFRILLVPISSFEALLSGRIARFIAQRKAKGIPEMLKGRKEMYDIFDELINNHENNLNVNDPQDVIDLYLREKTLRITKGDSYMKHFTKNAFVDTMIQIYGDGGYTVGAVVSYFLKELAKKPDVQDSIFHEIIEKVGTERFPTYEDRVNLPFTGSVIKELMRTFDVFPLVPSLVCTTSTTVSGVYVPKGAMVLLNFNAMNNDISIYRHPEKFDPMRYLQSGSNEERKDVSPMLFGIGKRSCLGETLVSTEIFLFVTAILQRFKLKTPEKEHIIRRTQDYHDPVDDPLQDEYNIIVTTRKKS